MTNGKEAIKIINGLINTAEIGYNACGAMFDDVPHPVTDALLYAISAIEKQNEGWIRCSERLPSNYGNYFIYTSEEEVDIGTFDELRGKWFACGARGYYWLKDRGIKVIAWRPIIVPNIKEIEDGSN